MNRTIEIKELEISCIVGIYPHERETQQPVSIDVWMVHDYEEAARTQEIAKTVNYAEVAEALTAWVQEQRALLLEHLAVGACEMILERWEMVEGVRIKVRKPRAIEAAKHAAVTFAKRRDSSAGPVGF